MVFGTVIKRVCSFRIGDFAVAHKVSASTTIGHQLKSEWTNESYTTSSTGPHSTEINPTSHQKAVNVVKRLCARVIVQSIATYPPEDTYRLACERCAYATASQSFTSTGSRGRVLAATPQDHCMRSYVLLHFGDETSTQRLPPDQ